MNIEKETVIVEIKNDYAIIQLNNGKVNAINTQLLLDLREVLDELDHLGDVKGAILTARPHVFCAGLDVMHLTSLDENGMLKFWESYMYCLQSLVKFSKPLVSAITGFAPAGGTILVLCTDYRIMGKGAKHVVGMHEFKMQMQVPEMLCDVYAYFLGEVRAWKAIQNAELFDSDQALEIGLVDESVEVEEVLARAETYLQKQIKIVDKVYAQSKAYFQKDLRRRVLDRDVPQLARETVEFNSDPKLQAFVNAFVASLKKKK